MSDLQEIKEDVKEVKEAVKGVAEKLTDLRLLVAGDYAKKAEFDDFRKNVYKIIGAFGAVVTVVQVIYNLTRGAS